MIQLAHAAATLLSSCLFEEYTNSYNLMLKLQSLHHLYGKHMVLGVIQTLQEKTLF